MNQLQNLPILFTLHSNNRRKKKYIPTYIVYIYAVHTYNKEQRHGAEENKKENRRTVTAKIVRRRYIRHEDVYIFFLSSSSLSE